MKPTNIAEILRNAPVGTLLYSPMVGYVNLVGVHDDVGERDIIEVEPQFGHKPRIRFDKYGKYVPDGERLLFPSKFNKTWNAWQLGLFGFGHFITSMDDKSETMVITKDDTAMAYRADGSCITICQLDYRWATVDERAAFLDRLGENGLWWNEKAMEIYDIGDGTTDIPYHEAVGKIKSLELENLKLNAILLLTGMYNVRDADLHNTVFNRIYGAKTKPEVDEIVWDYHTALNPNIGRANAVPGYYNMYEQKNGK